MISSKLQKDIIVNIVFAFLNILGVFVLTRLSTAVFAPAMFGLFMLVRRYSQGVATFAELGASIAQYRYMGMFAKEKRMQQLVSLTVLSFFVVVSLMIVFGVVVSENLLTHALFPDYSDSRAVLWFVVILGIQQLLHFNTMNNLLQERRMVLYNLYKLMTGFGIFVFTFVLLNESSIYNVFVIYIVVSALMLGVGQLYYNVLPLLRWREMPTDKLRWLTKEVFSYGFARGLVSFLNAGLFVVGPWLLRYDLHEVGYLSTIYLFFQTVAVILLPINQLSMVVSARQLGPESEERWEMGVQLLFVMVMIGTTIFTAAIYPWMDGLIRILVSNTESVVGIKQYSILLLCIIPLSVFNGLRGTIDMKWKRPFNIINLATAHVLGVLVFLVASIYYSAVISVILYSIVAFWVLGLLTIFTLRKYLTTVRWADLASLLGVSVVSIVGNIVLRDYLIVHQVSVIVQLVLISLSACAIPLVWWLCFRPPLLQSLLTQLGWNRIVAKSLGKLAPKS